MMVRIAEIALKWKQVSAIVSLLNYDNSNRFKYSMKSRWRMNYCELFEDDDLDDRVEQVLKQSGWSTLTL